MATLSRVNCTPCRVFAPADVSLQLGATFELPETDSHHLRDVLRLPVGAIITLVEHTSGRRFLATVTACAPRIVVMVGEEVVSPGMVSCVGAVLVALTKGDTPEWICEKVTELGARKILFFQGERSVVRLNEAAQIQKKQTRYQKIAEAAARQCDRRGVPELSISVSLVEAVSKVQELVTPEDRFFFCALSPGAKEFRELAPFTGLANVVIGPEGDFSDAEVALLLAKNFEPVSLGPTVLRAETAAVVSVAMMNAVWGWRGV